MTNLHRRQLKLQRNLDALLASSPAAHPLQGVLKQATNFQLKSLSLEILKSKFNRSNTFYLVSDRSICWHRTSKSKKESKSITERIIEAKSDIIDLCTSDDENNSSVLVNMRKKDLSLEVSDILKMKSSLLTSDDQALVVSYLKSQDYLSPTFYKIDFTLLFY